MNRKEMFAHGILPCNEALMSLSGVESIRGGVRWLRSFPSREADGEGITQAPCHTREGQWVSRERIRRENTFSLR